MRWAVINTVLGEIVMLIDSPTRPPLPPKLANGRHDVWEYDTLPMWLVEGFEGKL